jgi:hypothetical protein
MGNIDAVASRAERDIYMLAVGAAHANDCGEKNRALEAIALLLEGVWDDRIESVDREDAREEDTVDF